MQIQQHWSVSGKDKDLNNNLIMDEITMLFCFCGSGRPP